MLLFAIGKLQSEESIVHSDVNDFWVSEMQSKRAGERWWESVKFEQPLSKKNGLFDL